MTKKTLLSIMAGALLAAACSDYDALRSTQPDEPITFAPAVDAPADWNTTRGTKYTATTLDQAMSVSGYRYGSEQTLADVTEANFFYNEKVSKVNNQWTAQKSYYMPYDGDLLDFHAYTPAAATVPGVTPQNRAGGLQLDVNVLTDIDQQVDLMTAATARQTYDNTLGATVPLTFRHQMAAVRLVLDANVVPGSIQKIEFVDIVTAGTLHVKNSTWTNLTRSDFTIDYTAAGGNSTTNAYGFIDEGKDLLSSTLFMIPQTFTDNTQGMRVVIDTGGEQPQTLTAVLTSGDPQNPAKWEAGKTVTYRISTSDINLLQVAAVNYPATSTWGNAWVKTAFASGDKVGLYAIDASGTVQVGNTPLTLNGSGAWVTDEGTTQLFQPGLTWFVYSPYKAEGLAHNGKKDGQVVTTAADFFADGIAAWNPDDEQTSLSELLAQDLQVATGTPTAASTIRFDMAHTMGLVHLTIPEAKEVPNLVYFDGNEGTNSTTRVSTSSEMTTVAPSRSFTTNKPYDKGDNLFLFIARPGDVTLAATTTAAESYNAWDNSITATVSANAYTTKNVTNKCITRNYMKRGWVYEYSGSAKTFTLLATGSYTFECWGAQGGNGVCNGSAYDGGTSHGGAGGKGGYAKGDINLTVPTSLFVYVGGKGTNANYISVGKGGDAAGGWNGGGKGIFDDGDDDAGGGGGGATDIRITDGSWDSFASLRSRIMVAGGGGGSSYNVWGGSGGGLEGSYPTKWTEDTKQWESVTSYSYAKGTQTSGYKFGIGEDASHRGVANTDVAGAGGGYYGGKTPATLGGGNSVGGCGGSGFVSGMTGCNAITSGSTENSISHSDSPSHYSRYAFTNASMSNGQREGNGYARITENFIE